MTSRAARRSSRMTLADLTYAEVGATRADPLPPGYGQVHRTARLGTGRAVFERAATAVLDWSMHRGAGVAVEAGGAAAPGRVAVLRLGWGPLAVTAPCCVVHTEDEPGRRGFAYGTLPGHPERGEESFVVTMTPAGDVEVVIRAFSRPSSLLARAGGPVTGLVQQHVTDRYIASVRSLANP